MQLYSYFRSSAAYRVRIALNLKQLPYEIIPVHLVKNGGEQRSRDYLRINPQGFVPSLKIDSDVITESAAIIEYLEERFSEPSLLPESLLERARVRSLVQIVACDMHPLNNLSVLQYLEQSFDFNEHAKREWYHHWLIKGFSAIEALLKPYHEEVDDVGVGYCFHSQVTMADVYLIPQVYNARRFELDMSLFPITNRIYRHCSALLAFSDAAPEHQPDAE